LVYNQNVAKGLTRTVLNQPFSSAFEKHVAVQVTALLTGETKELDEWQWRVWRRPDEFGYRRSGKERYPDEITSDLLQSPVHRLVLFLAPALIGVYRNRFSKGYMAKRLSISEHELQNRIKELS